MERIIMKKKTWKRISNRWIISSLIALAIGLISGVYYYSALRASTQKDVLQTSTIERGNIILSATGLGTLIPSEEVSFGFKNGGEVSEVLVSLGEQVEAGQVLARLERGTLELKYKQAESNLAALSSPAEIASTKQAVLEAQESLAAAKDDLQFMIGPEMMIEEERVASAQDALKAAQAAAEKDSSAANQQKVGEAEAALAEAEATLA
jgi:HlyD family secretion protein